MRTNAPYYRQATYRVLVNATGKKTAAGEKYEDEFGKTLLTEGVKGQTFDDKQPAIKRGASEFIKLRNDREVVVRSWDGAKYKYTQMEKRYFAKLKKEYVIEVPVKTQGHKSAAEQGRTRTRDSTYERHAYMPVSHVGVAAIFANASLSPAQLEKRIKLSVMRALPYVTDEHGKKGRTRVKPGKLDFRRNREVAFFRERERERELTMCTRTRTQAHAQRAQLGTCSSHLVLGRPLRRVPSGDHSYAIFAQRCLGMPSNRFLQLCSRLNRTATQSLTPCDSNA